MGNFRRIRDDEQNRKPLGINDLSIWEDSGELPEPVPNEARYQAALRPDANHGKAVYRSGTPEGTRTPNLLIRSQTLYPIELRVHCLAAGGKKAMGWLRCQEFPSNSCSRGPKIPFA